MLISHSFKPRDKTKMNRFSLSQMIKLPRLADLIYPSYNQFYPEKLITEIGLYEAVLIDAADIQVFSEQIADKSPCLTVSRDFSALHKFVNSKNRIMLPCPECKQKQPFDLKAYVNPRRISIGTTKGIKPHKNSNMIAIPKENIYESVDGAEHCNIFDPPSIPSYQFGIDFLRFFDQTEFHDVDFEDYKYRCAIACVDGLAEQADEIRRDFFCTLSSQHRGFVDFIIYEAVDRYSLPLILQKYEDRRKTDPNTEMTADEKKAADAYKRLKTCLIMEKVGQYPSIADLQMFDIEKYKSVLSREYFRDFKTALGLYASGVGCGSFVYLRRIFEGLVIEAETEASKHDEWKAEEYEKLRFNEKLVYLEGLGQKLIPDEIETAKTKLYGILSRGVHASSDQDCIELFTVMKYAIEVLLDNKITKQEKEQKIKELNKILNSVK